MTIAEFTEYNKQHTMPREWIGQGYGYKAKWNPDSPTDIIYIPEYGYEDTLYDEDEVAGDMVLRENAYSYEDFMRICDGNEKKAHALFDNVDWQTPDSVLDEEWFEWE